jgi:hypothetical protein
MDHSACVRVPDGETALRAHIHEGVAGYWLWPDDINPDGSRKGLYDDSPTGAGF